MSAAAARELETALTAALTDFLREPSAAPLESLALRLLERALPAGVPEARARLAAVHAALLTSLAQLDQAVRAEEVAAHARTSRKGFLQSLDELIGPPTHAEWLAELQGGEGLSRLYSKRGEEEALDEERARAQLAKDLFTVCRREVIAGTQELVDRQKIEIPQFYEDRDYVQELVALGWSEGDATAFYCLAWPRPRMVIASALQQHDPTFSACTHAVTGALSRAAELQARRNLEVPRLYRHLRGIFSLAEADPEWTLIETFDRTGFRGLTSPVLTKVNCTATNICHEGFLQWNHATGRNELQDSDIVCFESAGPSQQGLHSAIMLDVARLNGAFPPNTLFRLKSVRAPGTWDAPGGIKVNQRLLVVTVTYRQSTLSARSGLVGGWVSPCAVSPLPLVVFPPAVCGGCAPLRSSDASRSFAFMRPSVEPSGVGMPDSGWQQSGRRGRAAAARISTSAETPAGTQASPQQACRASCAAPS